MQNQQSNHFTAHDLPPQFSHKTRSTNTFWIILISILFFIFLVFSKWNKIEDFLGFSTESADQTSGLLLGQEISVEGVLTQDGDFVTHTHTLTTMTSGVFGLKSKSVNLSQYSGNVLIEGVIDGQYQDLYIIDVSSIVSQLTGSGEITGSVETGIVESKGVYVPQAGIYFPESFFSEYQIVSTGTKNKIQIKSIASNKLITIDYFLCKRSDANRNCKQLSSTFADSNEKTFTTQNDVAFYKLAEVNSWFFANQESFGYFINDSLEQDVTNISSYIVLPTPSYVKENIEPKVSSLCKEGNIVMNAVQKTTFFIDQSKLAVTFFGTWEKGTAECTLLLDPSLSTYGNLKNFTYKDTTEISSGTQNSSTAGQSPIPASQSASDIKQFPISLDKVLLFTSSRGHTISFPSRKISYQSSTISDNLGIGQINCYVATNIVDYAKKDLVGSGSSVILYECKQKNALESISIPAQYRAIYLSDGRVFLVSVLDAAWIEFGQNIQVSLSGSSE